MTLEPASVAIRREEKALFAALLSGGDGRIAIDALSGLNKYFCPPQPAPDTICASSCTASPITQRGLDRAAETYRAILGGSPERQAARLDDKAGWIAQRLLEHFDVAATAAALLCPSGTDALLAAGMLVAAEAPGRPATAILPNAAETGTDVPLAAACRRFGGPAELSASVNHDIETVSVPLRDADGKPFDGEIVNRAYAVAAAAANGRAVVYLTHSTKTGLIAPASPPPGATVIVDACQARISAAQVARYLGQGWPVVVTGSKFFGGPAFSGAVLFPHARLAAAHQQTLAELRRAHAGNMGMVLRWTAALDSMDAFGAMAPGMDAFLRDRGEAVQSYIAGRPWLAAVPGLSPSAAGWADMPSIFTFAVRDPANPERKLTVAELRPIHELLAHRGILLGQPVGLGPFGGLRLAVGARDLLEGAADFGLSRLFAALHDVAAPALPARRRQTAG